MTTRIATVASALMLLTGTAFAQSSTATPPSNAPANTQSTATPGVTPGTPPSTVPAPRARPAQNPLMKEDVSKLNGTNVYGSNDKKIGDVTTELMNPSSKTIDRLVVSVGGVLGVGGHHVALPLSDFQWDGERGGFRVSKTEDELKSMAQWKEASASSR